MGLKGQEGVGVQANASTGTRQGSPSLTVCRTFPDPSLTPPHCCHLGPHRSRSQESWARLSFQLPRAELRQTDPG